PRWPYLPFSLSPCLLVSLSPPARSVPVGAERRRGQAGPVKEVTIAIVGPIVTDSYGLLHLGAGDEDLVALDAGSGRPPFFVRAGACSLSKSRALFTFISMFDCPEASHTSPTSTS